MCHGHPPHPPACHSGRWFGDLSVSPAQLGILQDQLDSCLLEFHSWKGLDLTAAKDGCVPSSVNMLLPGRQILTGLKWAQERQPDKNSFWFSPVWLPPITSLTLAVFILTFLPCLLNIFLTEPPPYPNRMSHTSAPNDFQAPCVPGTSAKRPFRCCRETLAKKTFTPVTQGQIQFLTLVLCFLLFPSSVPPCYFC